MEILTKLILMRGLPASGKSTVAKQLQKDIPDTVRLNKDLMREMLHFGEYNWRNEKQINQLEEFIAETLIRNGVNVIIDDTNLFQKHFDKWKALAVKCGSLFIEAKQTTDWRECVERDYNREKPVGEYVIKNFAMSLGQVEGDFVICDLDGTLCDITDRRHLVNAGGGEKDWKAFFENIPGDKVRYEVAEHVKFLNKIGYKIVYLSGRPEEYKQQTMEWLNKYGLDFNFTLIMRKKGDRRDDVIVKREMLNKYFPDRTKILGVIDDRPSVIRMWKEELGAGRVHDVGDGIEF